MGFNAAVGSLNTGTGAIGTTVVVSGLGFQPKIVFFWWNGRTDTVDAVGRRDHQRGFGAAISATDRRRIDSLSQDTPTSMVTNHSQDDTECIALTTTGGLVDGLMDLQSMDSGGFTLVVDDVFVASYRVQYLALGGTDIANVVGGTFTKAIVTGDQDITSLSFQPDLVLVFATGQSNMNGSIVADSGYTIGAAVPGSQAVIAGDSNSGAATSQTIAYCTDAEFISEFGATAVALNNQATFVQMLSNGFRINWSVNSGGADIFNFVALKGMGAVVGSLLTQTDTTTPIVESGFGFAPAAAMFFSHGQGKSTTGTVQDNDSTSIGAFSGTAARAAMAVMDQDNAATAVVGSAVENDEVYIHMPTTAATEDGLMDVQSLDSDGFTCIMDDADPAQSFVWYIAFGPAPSMNDAGEGVLVAVASGDDTEAWGDAGDGVLVTVASGADTLATTEAGAASSAFTASGADTLTTTEAGAASSAFTASGADTVAFTEAGSGVSILAGSGAEIMVVTETGAGVSGSAGSGADTVAFTEAGVAISALTGSGADAMTFTEAATALMGLAGSGADTFSSGGSTVYTEAGAGVAALFGFGADTVVMVDVGGGVLVAVGSGAESGAPSVTLPYQGDAYRYDDVSPIGAVSGGAVQADPSQRSPIGTVSGGTVLPNGPAANGTGAK